MRLIIAGNGGSAADAQHLAAEFLSRFLVERRPLPALALTTDTSVLTAPVCLRLGLGGRAEKVVAAKRGNERGSKTPKKKTYRDSVSGTLCETPPAP